MTKQKKRKVNREGKRKGRDCKCKRTRKRQSMTRKTAGG